MVTLARFPCAAGMHYRHDVQLITDNRRCEECIAMARALLTCFGERLAEENCFTVCSIAKKLSSRLARRIFDGRAYCLLVPSCTQHCVSAVFMKLYPLSCPAQHWSPARASGNRRLLGASNSKATFRCQWEASEYIPIVQEALKSVQKAPYLSLLLLMELRIA